MGRSHFILSYLGQYEPFSKNETTPVEQEGRPGNAGMAIPG